MTTLAEKIQDLNDLILQGKILEAFEIYYHPEVSMQENENEPTMGKTANRQREEAFVAAVTEIRSARVLKTTVGENCSMVEWQFDYTHKDWGVRHYKQVSVQEWKDGLIIHEKFYYNA